MATTEERVDKLETKFTTLERQVAIVVAKVDSAISEMQDMRQEMRDRDNQRAEDIREIRTSLQNMQSSSRTLNIATIIGIAAIVVAVLLK